MDHFRRSDTAHGKETATGVERPRREASQAITNLRRYGRRSPDSDSDSDSDPVGNLSLGLIVNMPLSLRCSPFEVRITLDSLLGSYQQSVVAGLLM